MAKKIYLGGKYSKGYYALVDDQDYERISQYAWQINQSGYAVSRETQSRNRKSFRMHRLVIEAKDGENVDHINRNKLDNRRSNLRIASVRLNAVNSDRSLRSSSRFVGVSWHKVTQKWRAAIHLNGRSVYLGIFDDEVSAAKAYDKAVTEAFGEHEYTNF